MSGLMIMGKIAKVEFSEKPEGWDVLIFEVEKYDNRLDRSLPIVLTALIPTNSKVFIKEFRENEGNVCIVPVEMRASAKGSSYLMVTGGVIDVSLLAL